MQWIIEAIKANTDEDGKVDLDKFETAVKAAFPKHAVPKDQYNTISEKLKSANETLTKLQDENKDISTLQTQIDEYKKQVEEKDKELIKTRNDATLKEALREAGASDIDYMIFKLGELEVDSEGNYKDLDNKIKSLKDSNPKWFESEDAGEGDEEEKDDKGGFKPIDNGLKDGKPPTKNEPETLLGALSEHYDKKQ